MTCFSVAVGLAELGSGTVVEGRVSNLTVTRVADASAAFCIISRSTVLKIPLNEHCIEEVKRLGKQKEKITTYHFPEYRERTFEIKPRVSTVTASSSLLDPIVRAFSALKSMECAIALTASDRRDKVSRYC